MAKMVPVRFSDEMYARYEARAAEAFPHPLPVSTYLKQRLAAGDHMADAIWAWGMRSMIWGVVRTVVASPRR